MIPNVADTINPSTTTELIAALNAAQLNAAESEVYFKKVRTIGLSSDSSPLRAGVWLMLGWKHTPSGTYGYGGQMFFSYSINEIVTRKIMGEVIKWNSISGTNIDYSE